VQQGTNIAIIAPDLLDIFPDSEAVNEALLSLKQIAERTGRRNPPLKFWKPTRDDGEAVVTDGAPNVLVIRKSCCGWTTRIPHSL
jgi:hypothetical protein